MIWEGTSYLYTAFTIPMQLDLKPIKLQVPWIRLLRILTTTHS